MKASYALPVAISVLGGFFLLGLVVLRFLPETKGQGFRRWLEACEAGKSNGRTATLLLGSPAVGFTIALHGVRPVRIDDLAASDSDDPRRRDLRVELKTRDIAFALAPGK
mgnify:CR=1 FL=1